jgi:hypothetical protein
MCGPGDPARAQRAGPHCPPHPHRAAAPAPGAPGWPRDSRRRDIASPRPRPTHRWPPGPARPPPDAPWEGCPRAAPTTHAHRSLRVVGACVRSPSSVLPLLCALRLVGRASPWGRTTGDGEHPFIRLHHTGRAHPARLKRDVHLQGGAAGAVSPCHAGLLAPVARGFHAVAHAGVAPPETHHHTRVAVGFVECSSRTLP